MLNRLDSWADVEDYAVDGGGVNLLGIVISEAARDIAKRQVVLARFNWEFDHGGEDKRQKSGRLS